jgi:sigma-B regulation protein RsbU (phosphoserine phosphatase)
MFVTLFYAVIDTETREMRYTNAGHNYPIVFHEDNEEFESLEDGGLLMGMFEQATYQEGKLTLRVGDVVCFYTDGIVEAMNDDNEMYGFERLCELVQMHKEKEAHAIRDIIMEDTTLFMGMSPQYDDITVIVIKVNHDAIEITENNNKIALNV